MPRMHSRASRQADVVIELCSVLKKEYHTEKQKQSSDKFKWFLEKKLI